MYENCSTVVLPPDVYVLCTCVKLYPLEAIAVTFTEFPAGSVCLRNMPVKSSNWVTVPSSSVRL